MRTSVKWINDYLSTGATAAEQAETLTAVGFPVESGGDLDTGDRWQEVELTSNRGDCLSHLGLAREIAAATGRLVAPPSVHPRQPVGTAAASVARVTNHDHARCPRYTARIIKGVKVGPSPEWLRERLLAIGQIPRNNIVDCSNFVLFELGQPTHAFDLARLEQAEIQVRAAREGESFTPIGEGAKPIRLRGGELVIADACRPVALAGVKGGAESAVHEGTRDLLIESAAFDPVAVRTTRRWHQISSDSSYRFERGVAPGDVDAAAERLVALILETAGGTALDGSIAAGTETPAATVISLRLARLAAVAGFTVAADEAIASLTALGISTTRRGEAIECSIPPRRIDLTREIDLIEEVVRLAGLDRIQVRDTLPIRPVPAQATVASIRAARDALAGAGFIETVTHTLISERAAAPFLASGCALLSTEDSAQAGEPILRPSLVPSLLQTLALNRDRGADATMLFEHGATFWRQGDSHAERRTLALVVADARDEEAAVRRARGALDGVVATLRGSGATIAVRDELSTRCANTAAALRPFGSVWVDGGEVGSIGLVNADALGAFGLNGVVAAIECEWAALSRGYPPIMKVHALAASPVLDRDLSLVVDDSCTWARLAEAIRAASLPHLERLDFVGTWRGKGIASGRKSVTMRLLFRCEDRTLRREEIDPEISKLVKALGASLGAELRT